MIRKNILILSILFFAVILLIIFFPREIFFKPEEPQQMVKAKVAIVIDDWGYNWRHIDLLKEIKVPVTISILPNLRYSTEIAEIARSLGQEVILHLPLEPELEERKIGLEEYTITSDMSEEEIVKNFELALSSVPYALGVSNHMGSRATKDSRLMSIIFAEIKKRDMFFLDNLVTEKSICRQLAREMQVKFISRDFFLDNLDDIEYIKEQFKKLTEFAQEFGHAVGDGHAKPATLKAFKEAIPMMQEKGIEFVFLSDLVE